LISIRVVGILVVIPETIEKGFKLFA